MVIKVGINGFGRVGRIVSRACLQNSELELSAINDPAISIDYVCYLMKFDSTHGKLSGEVTYDDNGININGRHISVFHEKLPENVPWACAGVQYVVEASGMFTTYEKAVGHLKCAGVKRVIVTAPSVDIPMIILGVNSQTLKPERKVISCASSTLYCLAPIVKVLEDSYGVEDGFITSIHAMTPSLKPLDGLCLKGRHWRDHRSIHQNIIPASTGACKALGKILPQVKDKLSGLAFRVPIVNVSVLDLTIRLKTNTNLQEIAKSVEQASKSTLRNVIKTSNEESVSSDFIGENHSCIFDENSSVQQRPNFFKIICWYENEFSYACRVVDTITISEKQMFCGISPEIPCLTKISLGRSQNVEQQIKWSKKYTSATSSKIEISPEIIATVSQETGVQVKASHHSLFIKKPPSVTTPSPQTCKESRTNELLRIWNNTIENPEAHVKQNRCSLFQACKEIGFQAQPVMVECKTQERLENVKREFSKMLNLSEDLLKKTHSNQCNARLISKEQAKDASGTNVIGKDAFKGDAESIRLCECNRPVEENNNCKSSEVLCNSTEKLAFCSKNESLSLMSYYDKKLSDQSECNSLMSSDDRKFIVYTRPRTESKESNTDDKNKLKLVGSVVETGKEKSLRPIKKEHKPQRSKTFDTFVDGFSQNVQVQYVWNNNNNCLKIKTPFKKEKTANDDQSKDTSTTNFEPDCKNLSCEKKNNIIPITFNDYKTRLDKSNIKFIDKVLRKRNIILVDKSFVPETGSGLRIDERKKTGTEIGEHFILTPLSEKSSPEMIQIASEELTKGASEIITARNVGNVNIADIYDKLDSISGSDSNNSFEINERKSQVLQITDLTNSLEDLSRLDKICRIIEISDELSDKLFSALDDKKDGALSKKTWSFKDLCTRIQLDDFCNKAFGGTV